MQRELNFAIVDEVDSILIDEARTPLIISGPTDQTTDLYYRINAIIPQLKTGARLHDRRKDQDRRAHGRRQCARRKATGRRQSLRPGDNMDLVHHVVKALQAYALYKRDVDYVVKDGEVIIVDEFTGRLMPGRRWSDGLHQAVEAKEGVKIANENQTLASVTFQNYFRMYKKLGGMTGTADTEAAEFAKIYNLDVNVVPTNRQDDPAGLCRRRLPHGEGKVRRDRRRDQGLPRTGPAGTGRHDLHRKIGTTCRHAQPQRRQTQRAQRQTARDGKPRSSRRPAARAP